MYNIWQFVLQKLTPAKVWELSYQNTKSSPKRVIEARIQRKYNDNSTQSIINDVTQSGWGFQLCDTK